jgi:predicted NAD/FAD-dependent oxidoreductase
VNVALTAGASARLWQAPDAAVVDCALASLARTPVGRLAPRRAVVHRWDPMLPQLGAGALPRLARFLARTDRSPRLAFAGDYLVGPYTEAALTSGLRAASEIARAL